MGYKFTVVGHGRNRCMSVPHVFLHLIRLAQHSDAVLITILTMAERLSEKPRHRCAGYPARDLVLQNVGQEWKLSEGS